MITNNTSSFLGRWAGTAAKGYKGGGENVGLGDRRAAHPDQTHTHTHTHTSKLVKMHTVSMCGIVYVNNMSTKL